MRDEIDLWLVVESPEYRQGVLPKLNSVRHFVAPRRLEHAKILNLIDHRNSIFTKRIP
jgi:hypothetical protein